MSFHGFFKVYNEMRVFAIFLGIKCNGIAFKYVVK